MLIIDIHTHIDIYIHITRMWGRMGYVALKLDMSKAYDRLEWNFLEAVMRRMGFEHHWILLIMQCLKSVRYSILVNGQPVGDIRPSRGIRQGDPLSPYLFILCAEALSSLLHHAESTGWLAGVPTSPKGPRLNHLFFADDSLLFCKATSGEWCRLSNLLEQYEKASGQKLNKEKTSIFFSRNTSQEAKDCILQLSGIPATQRYDKYLGLPALVGKSRVREFQSIKERVWKRLNDWKTKFLSQAGKEILIKAVIQAIPTYSMSVFLLPKVLCKELNSLMQKFWWGHKENTSKIHWMSWDKMGFAKSKGGMGFRELSSFNKALLAKQCWRLLQEPDSLVARIMKAKYFRNVAFMDVSLCKRPSFAFRSICSARELLKEGLVWRIGNGEDVNIWGDKWLPTPSTYAVQSPRCILSENAKVVELIDRDSKWWNLPLIHDIFRVEEAVLIPQIPLSRYNQKDVLTWRGTTSGEFTVRSAYHMERDRTELLRGEGSKSSGMSNFWKTIWGLRVPNPVKMFVWRACNNILPTKDNLQKRGMVLDPLCIFCMSECETVKHILWDCPSASDVWGVCGRKVQKSSGEGSTFIEVLENMIERGTIEDLEFHAVIARKIWFRRNTVVHGGEFSHPNVLLQEAVSSFTDYKNINAKDGRPPQLPITRVPTKWQFPPPGLYKVNWDAAIDSLNKRMGMGIIVRDCAGQVIAAKSQTVFFLQDPVIAEAQAALCAVEFSRDLGLQSIILEGDSLQVVNALKDPRPNWTKYGQLVADAKGILIMLRSWQICHTNREANCAAHGLAKVAVKQIMDRVWIEDIPMCIRDIVILELLALAI
jgi:ribonuclease HI